MYMTNNGNITVFPKLKVVVKNSCDRSASMANPASANVRAVCFFT